MFIISNALWKKNIQVIKPNPCLETVAFGVLLAPAVRRGLSVHLAWQQLQRALLLFMGLNDMHKHTPGPASQSI